MPSNTKRKLARDVSQLFCSLLDENPFPPVNVHHGCLPDKALEGTQQRPLHIQDFSTSSPKDSESALPKPISSSLCTGAG